MSVRVMMIVVMCGCVGSGGPGSNCTERSWFVDGDGDGFADPRTEAFACEAPDSTYVTVPDGVFDCDDSDAAVHPGASEICDPSNVDEDCDGESDDADGSVDLSTATGWFPDGDEDGYGISEGAVTRCDDPTVATRSYASRDGDCDDLDPLVHPGATEICDEANVDEDCSGAADDDDPGVDPTTQTAWHVDADGDGYGDADAPPVLRCDGAEGSYVDNDRDCDDAHASAFPGAVEVCNGIDDDCDGLDEDAGLVSHEAPDGTFTDRTAEFSAPTGFAAVVTEWPEGTTHVCEGRWPLQLRVGPEDAAVVLVGHEGAGPVELNAMGGRAIEAFETDISLSGVTVMGANGTWPLWHVEQAKLRFEDVRVERSYASSGDLTRSYRDAEIEFVDVDFDNTRGRLDIYGTWTGGSYRNATGSLGVHGGLSDVEIIDSIATTGSPMVDLRSGDLEDVTLAGNFASESIVHVAGDARLTNLVIKENTIFDARFYGGPLYLQGGDVTITGGEITDNDDRTGDGAITVLSTSSLAGTTLVLSGVNVSGNPRDELLLITLGPKFATEALSSSSTLTCTRAKDAGSFTCK